MSANPTSRETSASMLTVPETVPPEVAVEVRGLQKSFRIPTQRIDTLKERATQLFSRTEYRELRALRGIDFDVHRGEFFGIVGRNGSGKSTLLKLLGEHLPRRRRARSGSPGAWPRASSSGSASTRSSPRTRTSRSTG